MVTSDFPTNRLIPAGVSPELLASSALGTSDVDHVAFPSVSQGLYIALL